MKPFKKITSFFIPVIFVPSLFCLTIHAQDIGITLSLQSLQNAQIVLPQKSSVGYDKFAALLQKRLQQSLGQSVPVVAEDKASSDKILFHVGPTKACLAAVPEQKDLPLHTYIVRSDGKSNIYFAGPAEFTVGFAVVEFADKVLNIRQYMPGSLGECITKSQSVTVPAEIKAPKPDLASVFFSGLNFGPESTTMLYKEMEIQFQLFKSDEFHHNFYRIFPVEKYGQTHPEYYPGIDGKRNIPSDKYDKFGLTAAWQPCISNPQVVQVTVDYCLNWFKTHPNATSVSIAVNDGGGWCNCDKCTAEMKRLGKPESNLYYDFANKVARAVGKVMPDKMVGFIAYSIADNPPSFPIEKNVLVYKVHPSVKDGLAPWGKLGASTGAYTWLYGGGYVTPRYFPHEFQKSLKKWEEQGAKGLYAEAYPNWIVDAPMLYAVSKMGRNINVDIDGLLGQYAKDMYGSAAPEIVDFYHTVEKAMARREKQPYMQDDFNYMSNCARPLRYQFMCWRIEDVQQMDKALEKGIAKLTADSLEAQRMNVLRDWWSYSRQFILLYKNADNIAEMPVNAAKDLDQAGPVITSLLDSIEQLKDLWKNKFGDIKKNVKFAEYYRCDEQLDPVAFEESCLLFINPEIWPGITVDNGLKKASDMLIKKIGKEKTAATWQDLAVKYPKAAPMFISQKTLALGKLENVIFNGSFEKLDPFETKDTTPLGFMCWQSKNSHTDCGIDDKVAHSGKRSWRQGEGVGAVIHYVVAVMPNSRYLVSYWVRKAHPAKDARVVFILGEKDPGKMAQVIAHVVPTDIPANTWVKQEFIVTIPEHCDKLGIDLAGKNYLDKGDVTWFDDLTACRIY